MSKLTQIGSKTESVLLCAMISMLALALSAAAARADGGGAATSLEAATFRIMSADGSQVLGHGEYHVENSAAQPVLVGQNRYIDGEYDVERDIIAFGADGGARLVSFEHSFFNADGSQKFFGRADLRKGEGECTGFEANRERALVKHIDFPADTYAGATAVMALENALRTGVGEASFHVFDCGPAPRVVAVAAQLGREQQESDLYPRKLMQVDVTADLGWLGSLVDGLLPHRRAWFDPSAGWHFVAGKIQRYFASGPLVMLVREETAFTQRASN